MYQGIKLQIDHKPWKFAQNRSFSSARCSATHLLFVLTINRTVAYCTKMKHKRFAWKHQEISQTPGIIYTSPELKERAVKHLLYWIVRLRNRNSCFRSSELARAQTGGCRTGLCEDLKLFLSLTGHVWKWGNTIMSGRKPCPDTQLHFNPVSFANIWSSLRLCATCPAELWPLYFLADQ